MGHFIQNRLSGEGGIRTHGTLTSTLPFQGSQFSHSCTSPKYQHQIYLNWLLNKDSDEFKTIRQIFLN